MSDRTLQDDLADAEARVLALKLKIAGGSCSEVGHDWKHIGGANAGCSPDCMCSVPVNECTKCGDCDYGDNAWADHTVAECQRMRA